MADTATADKVATETDVPREAPAPQLPATQTRKPPTPRNRATPVYAASIAKAILKVSQAVGVIQKEGKNTFQNYAYAKWEDINEKLSPLLVENNLVLIQAEQSRSLLEENDKGSVLAIVYEMTWMNAETGETWPPVPWTGIARLRDQKGVTDDKAATKCATQAEKFFCVKQFKIIIDDVPVEDTHALPKKNARDIYEKMQKEIDNTASVMALDEWGSSNNERLKTLPRDWQGILRERFNEKRADLENEMREFENYDKETGEVKDG